MSIETFKSVLKRNNYKATPARLAILDIFSRTNSPLSAEVIFKKLKKNGIDKVTVYRTLNAFQKTGILKKVSLQKEADYYEMADDHHHHIICTKCGRIEDFDFCPIGSISKKVLSKSPYFKKIDQHSIELFSVCKVCSKR